MTSNPVAWFELYVQDMVRARAFYQAVFETDLERLDSPAIEMWAFPERSGAAGAAGALVHFPGMPSGGNSTVVYFRCDDCAVEAGRVAPAGGTVFREKFSIGPYGFAALVRDPDGNMIGLYSER
jgi:uncharacterized protein